MTADRGLALRGVVLDAVHVHASTRLPANVAATMQLSETVDLITNTIVYDLHGYIYGHTEQHPETHHREFVVEYPATWWQAFKLSAIEQGNPFFDPAKVRYTRKTRRAEITVVKNAVQWWPGADFPVPPRWGAPILLDTYETVDWKIGGDL